MGKVVCAAIQISGAVTYKSILVKFYVVHGRSLTLLGFFLFIEHDIGEVSS